MRSDLINLARTVLFTVAAMAIFGVGLASAALLAQDDAPLPATAETAGAAEATEPVETPSDDEPAPTPSEGGPDGFVAPEPEPTPDGPCGGSGAVPEGASGHLIAGGDVDGDGEMDTIHGYGLSPSERYLQVSFAAGGGVAVQVPINAEVKPTMPLDGLDMNGSGTDEIMISIGGGASGLTYAVYRLADCELERITHENGDEFTLSSWASIGHFGGFGCEDGDGNGANDWIVTWRYTDSGDQVEYHGTVTEYFLQPDGGFVLSSSADSTWRTAWDLTPEELHSCDLQPW